MLNGWSLSACSLELSDHAAGVCDARCKDLDALAGHDRISGGKKKATMIQDTSARYVIRRDTNLSGVLTRQLQGDYLLARLHDMWLLSAVSATGTCQIPIRAQARARVRVRFEFRISTGHEPPSAEELPADDWKDSPGSEALLHSVCRTLSFSTCGNSLGPPNPRHN